MMYCVGLGSPSDKYARYISTCDDKWYETTSVKLYQFTQPQVNTVVKHLRKHNQFDIFVLDIDNNVIFERHKKDRTEIPDDVIQPQQPQVNKPQENKPQENKSTNQTVEKKKGLTVKIKL